MTPHILYSVIFLPLILIIGLITSRDDLFTSKIRNKWVLLGLSYAFIVYIVSWSLYFLSLLASVALLQNPIQYLIFNFDKWCINLIISIAVAYTLWRFKMWGAGDAKLFVCFSALIPMGQYTKVYFKYYFASFLLLQLIFIPATIFLLVRSCLYFMKRFDLKITKESAKDFLRERFNGKGLIVAGKIIFGFLVFLLFFRILRVEFTNFVGKFLTNQTLLVAISLVIFRPLSQIFRKNAKFMFAIFFFLILYMIFKKVQPIPQIVSTLSGSVYVMVLAPAVKWITDLYVERTTKKTTPFAFWIFLGVLLAWFWK